MADNTPEVCACEINKRKDQMKWISLMVATASALLAVTRGDESGCGAGMADHDGDTSTPCVACPAGRFRQAGSPEDLEHGCVACAAGDFAPSGASRCVPRVAFTPAMVRGYTANDEVVQLTRDIDSAFNGLHDPSMWTAWDVDAADMDGRLAALCSNVTNSGSATSARLLGAQLVPWCR